MGTDKKKVQGAIINEVGLEKVNQEGCLLGFLKSLIEEQNLPRLNSETVSTEELKGQQK